MSDKPHICICGDCEVENFLDACKYELALLDATRCLRDLLGWIPADQPEHRRIGELLTRIEQ